VTSERKVFKDNFYLTGILFEHLPEYRHKPGTVRSLEIIENRNHNRCIGRSFEG